MRSNSLKTTIALLFCAFSLSSVSFACDDIRNKHAKFSSLVQASCYGESGEDTIGVLIYYGTGNKFTEQQVGEFVLQQIYSAAERQKVEVNPQYFITNLDAPGLAVGYHMGNTSVDATNFKDGVQPAHIEKVIKKRLLVTDLLQ